MKLTSFMVTTDMVHISIREMKFKLTSLVDMMEMGALCVKHSNLSVF